MNDYPDWIEAEICGLTLNNEEFKAILQETDVDEDDIENYTYYTYIRDENIFEYNQRLQNSYIISRLMYEARMYPPQKDKLAGWPHWIQDIEYPNCPTCNQIMNQFIFQFETDDNIPYLWGDAGAGYFVQCPEHKDQVAFLWQCG